MDPCYRYAVAQFETDPLRNERLNLAIVILHDDSLEVRLPKSLDKLRAISAAIDLDLVRDHLNNLPDLDKIIRSQGKLNAGDRISLLSDISAVGFSSLGEIFAPNDHLYNHQVDRLVSKLVEPEPAPLNKSKRRPTPLQADLKRMFKAERVLAQKGDTLETHKIVPNHAIAEGLSADFVLKNGSMHVVQTVDASQDEGSARRAIHSIGTSALVFEYARMTFGDQETKANLVYKAAISHERVIAPALDAAAHQGAKLINWESRDDRTRFVVELSSLAEPTEVRNTRSFGNVHASTQSKLRLN